MILALGANDGILRLWSPGTREFTMVPIGDGPVRVAVGKNGRRLFASSGDMLTTVDPASGQILSRIQVHRAGFAPTRIMSLCWFPTDSDDGYVAVGTEDGHIQAFDVATLAPRWDVALAPAAVFALQVALVHGITLVAGGADGALTLVDTGTRTTRRIEGAHSAQINQIATTMNRVLSASDDGTLRSWDPVTLAPTGRLRSGGWVNAVAEVRRPDGGKWTVLGDSQGTVHWSDDMAVPAVSDRRHTSPVTAVVPFDTGGPPTVAVLRRGGVIELHRPPEPPAATGIGDQELVVHLFALLDGPNEASAVQQIRAVWAASRRSLGMTRPNVEAGLSAELPADLARAQDGAIAGIQDATADFQAVVRRDHDVLNLSLAMAADPNREDAQDWAEFTRRWTALAPETAGTLLGTAVVYMGLAANPSTDELRAALAAGRDGAPGWWRSRIAIDELTVWEVGLPGDGPARRLVAIGRPGQHDALSRLAWSDGSAAMPPLARYLMHAAKLRHQSRVRNRDDQRIAELTEQATTHPETVDPEVFNSTLLALHRMRRSAVTASTNMTRSLPDPLPSDLALADTLLNALGDDIRRLESARERIGRSLPAGPAEVVPASEPEEALEFRVAFGIDVVEFSSRSYSRQLDVRRRLAEMVVQVLAALGLELHETDRQDAGDGLMIVLSPRIAVTHALPVLLYRWRDAVAADNAGHPEDRIRLRLSIASGPLTAAPLGFIGATIVQVGRLLDSATLRAAASDFPDADVVALVADRIYQDVVGEGYPGLSSGEFTSCTVQVKEFHSVAWLWTGGAAPVPAAAALSARSDLSLGGPPGSSRDVFLLHGRDMQAASAVAGLLRALDLRPLAWEDMVVRTGQVAPNITDVMREGLAGSQAVLAILTPDVAAPGGSNLLLELGTALALNPERTIIMEIGEVPPLSGLAGRNIIRMNGSVVALAKLAERLRTAGCAVNTNGIDWLDTSRFEGLDALRES
ncbi:CATRA conflict system CASPASE/TPR repeat-associated protein [Micromonospora zamorensis]|uniref:CATRA conflict system CASPASE/TPR repeat-associated protein n=1 Tax=Micromonospora zamorensis TaxID=709883 RepID=UPI00340B5C0E